MWISCSTTCFLKKYQSYTHILTISNGMNMSLLPPCFSFLKMNIQRLNVLLTVSHFSYAPLFKAHIFWQKCWNQTFSMIIYLLTFYLFVDIKNIFEITHAKHSAASKAILLTVTKMHVQPERLYFLFAFCAMHYPWWSLWQKNTKKNYFIQVKPLFSVVEFSNTVTFWRNACFDVILTSATIIKQGFLHKLFCYESLVDIEVSKH